MSKQERNTLRSKRRFNVKFGIGKQLEYSGFTNNISKCGMRIQARTLYRPETRITILLLVPPDKNLVLFGTVKWARQSPPGMQAVKPSAMGIEIDSRSPSYEEFQNFLASFD